MKHALYIVFFFLTFGPLQAASNAPSSDVKVEAPQDEVARVDQLIAATKDTLKRLEALRAEIIVYKQAEAAVLKNPNDPDAVAKLVISAKQIQDLINTTYVQEYFSPQFLEEIHKFAQIAEKNNIPPAK